MPLIAFKNVQKYYGDYHALKDINLEIEEGQVVVLLGPSGSGKSTLIRTINALEGIESGELIVNGHHVDHATKKDLVELVEVILVLEQRIDRREPALDCCRNVRPLHVEEPGKHHPGKCQEERQGRQGMNAHGGRAMEMLGKMRHGRMRLGVDKNDALEIVAEHHRADRDIADQQ